MPRTLQSSTARYITELFSPAILVGCLLLLQPLLSPNVSWLQAIVAAFFVTGLPFLMILWMKKRGSVSDHHVSKREQRAPVLIAAALSLGAGTLALTYLQAPAALLGEIAAVFLGLVLCLVVNLVWKVSVHAAVATYVGLALLIPVPHIGPGLALLLAASVGWSRIELKAHTPAQVLVGQVIGCVAFAASLLLT
jgi:membrane-associated phospholipid phosphatase